VVYEKPKGQPVFTSKEKYQVKQDIINNLSHLIFGYLAPTSAPGRHQRPAVQLKQKKYAYDKMLFSKKIKWGG